MEAWGHNARSFQRIGSSHYSGFSNSECSLQTPVDQFTSLLLRWAEKHHEMLTVRRSYEVYCLFLWISASCDMVQLLSILERIIQKSCFLLVPWHLTHLFSFSGI